MVRFTNNRKRYAFTMIELIFAIVVIGISVLSLPMITQATQKGIEENIVQEAIFAASSDLIGATAGYWDERSMDDINTSTLSRVIDIEGDCVAGFRPGHIKDQPKHRRCLESYPTLALNQNNSADIFSLDDAEQTTLTYIFESDGGGTGIIDATGYKEAYKSTVTVEPKNTTGNDRNIKIITVTIENSSGETVTVLKAQSANVGEIDYYKRSF